MERTVYAAGPFKDIIPDAVRVGDVVHLSGAVAVMPELLVEIEVVAHV